MARRAVSLGFEVNTLSDKLDDEGKTMNDAERVEAARQILNEFEENKRKTQNSLSELFNRPNDNLSTPLKQYLVDQK